MPTSEYPAVAYMLEKRALDEDFHASLTKQTGQRVLFGPMAA